jgi:hypothetical protein
MAQNLRKSSQNSQPLNFDRPMSDSSVRLSLSAKGLQRIENVNHEKNFAFIVGDERYYCPSFVAEFLSPRVSSLRSQDITIDEFSIDTADPDHHFEWVLSIGFGREVSFGESDLSFVRSVCGNLSNSELFEKTLKHEEGHITEAGLKARIEFLSGVDGSGDFDVSVVASHFYELSVSDFDQLSPSILEAILIAPGLVVEDEDSVFEIVHRRASADHSYFRLLEFVRLEFVSVDCMRKVFDFISNSFDSFTFGIWSSLRNRLTLPVTPPSVPGRFKPLPSIESKIMSAIPDIFSVFGDKQLQLLYRGSRDGFEASAFHRLCDGHRNTVTLISSTNDCIFGGYTPLPWSSRNEWVSDPSLTSFVFTIKNPHNLPSRIFKQKHETYAILTHPSYGPTFGDGHTVHVCDQCHTCNRSYSVFTSCYPNDTGIANNQVFTGAQNFTVKEIEVFEVSGRT